MLGASTIILSKEIDKYAFMCGLNFYETDVNWKVHENSHNVSSWERRYIYCVKMR